MTVSIPRGYRFAGVHCGIKSDPQRNDLSLVVSDVEAVAVGVYTTNRVCGAPVVLSRSRTPSTTMRAVVINSGIANACTGEQGDRDARQMTQWVAKACGGEEDQALVLSTGLIGELLPMDRIRQGIRAANKILAKDSESLIAAARGMMTTDTVPKLASQDFRVIGGPTARVTGLAKGAAMIGPNMATMLAILTTDAPIDADLAQRSLSAAVDESFNCISVDGHMSTSDAVVLLANGAVGGPAVADESIPEFQRALRQVCLDLARAIPADGEGAEHLITIDVQGCASRHDARCIAKAVADSPLVKTAVAGGDPNWGRIVSAAGYAGVSFEPTDVSLSVNGHLLYERGMPVDFDAAVVSDSMKRARDVSIILQFSRGAESIRFWTTDLTAEYIRLNAEYHT